VRRIVELTGLGIAATYFLDPERGAERRRAAWGFIAGARHAPAMPEPVALQAAPEPEKPFAAPDPAEELVLLTSEQLTGSAPPDAELYWPSWGWALVVTITVCALAAFAAVGLGIWAIEHRTSATTTRTVTAPDTRAAPVLADPTARRIIGTAPVGRVLLRLNSDGAALAVDGLPPLAPGARYRVWISAAGATTAAGAFASTRAVLTLRPLVSGSRIMITREPANAAPGAPSGPQLATVTVPP
jgi:hypothetical protein